MILIFFVLPWLISIKRARGEKRYKNICQLCMVVNVIVMFAISFALAILVLGERSDIIGKLAYAACVLIPLLLGPLSGIKIFIYFYKEKLGKIGAKQICTSRFY